MYRQQSKLYQFLKNVWPYIYKAINNTIYFIFNLVRTVIKESIQMIKTGGIGD